MKGEKISRRVLNIAKKGENFPPDSPDSELSEQYCGLEDTQYAEGPNSSDFNPIVDSISSMNVHAQSRCNAETNSPASSPGLSGYSLESHPLTDSDTALDTSDYCSNPHDPEYSEAVSSGGSNLDDTMKNLRSPVLSAGSPESPQDSTSSKFSGSPSNRDVLNTYYNESSPPTTASMGALKLPQEIRAQGNPVNFDIFTPNTVSELNCGDGCQQNGTGYVDASATNYEEPHPHSPDNPDPTLDENHSDYGDDAYYYEDRGTSDGPSVLSHDYDDQASNSGDKSSHADSNSYDSNDKSEVSKQSHASYNPEVSESEDSKSYAPGGYHPVHVGEVYNHRYKVEAKLGWGYFSTVWLASDLSAEADTFVALKFQRSAKIYTDAVYDEIEMLTDVNEGQTSSEWVNSTPSYSKILGHNYNPSNGVVSYIDNFKVTGPNGYHICVVFEVMGPNLLALIKLYNFQGIPINLVKKITAHVLLGLDYLHRVCKIIHTDLKPENILVTSPLSVDRLGNDPLLKKSPGKNQATKGGSMNSDLDPKKKLPHLAQTVNNGVKPSALSARNVEIDYVKKHIRPSLSDPSLATSYEDRYALQETFIRRPYHHVTWNLMREVDRITTKSHYHPSIVSSSGVNPFGTRKTRIKTTRGFVQIKPYTLDHFNGPQAVFKICDLGNACWIDKHFTEEIQTRQYRAPEAILNIGYDNLSDIWSLACVIFELVTGDYLFDPYGKESIKRDSNHLLLIAELLGPIPNYMIQESKKSKKLAFDEINKIKRWPLESVLVDKYKMDKKEATDLANFLSCMLRINPSERHTAQQLLSHRWLTST